MHVQEGTTRAGLVFQPSLHRSAKAATTGTAAPDPRQVLERKLGQHQRDLTRVLAGERDALLGRLTATRREAAGELPLTEIRRGVGAYRALVDTAVTEVSKWAAGLWPLVERIVDATPELTASEVKALGCRLRPDVGLRSPWLDPIGWSKEAFRGLGGLSGTPRPDHQEVIEILMSVETARAVEAIDEALAHGLHGFGLAVDEHFLLRTNGLSVPGGGDKAPSVPECGTPLALKAPTEPSWEMCLPCFPPRVDGVAEAIRAAVKMLIAKLGKEPDRHQVWNALAAGEVQGYVVEVMDRATLKIEGMALARESFRKRWATYTLDRA